MTIIDLETISLPKEQLEKFKPEFRAPSNYVNPTAIENAIKKKEEAWWEKTENTSSRAKALSFAAVSSEIAADAFILPFTGTAGSVNESDDRSLIEHAAQIINSASLPLVGFKICRTILPFIAQRVMMHGMASLLNRDIFSVKAWDRRLTQTPVVIDIAQEWNLGDYATSTSLEEVITSMTGEAPAYKEGALQSMAVGPNSSTQTIAELHKMRLNQILRVCQKMGIV